MMETVLEQIRLSGIVPVLNTADAAAAKAVLRGGNRCLEIVWEDGAGEEALAAAAAAVPEMLLGAGGITTAAQAEKAARAGANFLSGRDFDEDALLFAEKEGLAVLLPGANCMVTGSAGDAAVLLKMPGILACECTEFLRCPAEEIEWRIRAAMEAMLRFAVGHTGINTPDASSGERAANWFGNAFGFPVREAPTSYFAGPGIETLKGPYMGGHGHIAINCSDVDRAMRYLKIRGYTFREETVKRNPTGAAAAYLEGEIEGFAIHLRNG